MCTECFLQVRPQKEKDAACPFCNCEGYSVVLKKKKLDVPAMCYSETTSSISDSSGYSSTISDGNLKKSPVPVASRTPKAETKTTGFGSELEKDERFKRLKERSESFASSDGTSMPKKEQEIIQSIAMTEKDRQQLEEEMKAQHNHPLVLRLEAEAQERRLENDRAYQSSNASSSSTSRNQHIARRARLSRNWDQLSRFLDQGEETDDITALETAILFSRMAEEVQGEESNGHHPAGRNTSNNGTRNAGDREMEGFTMLRSLLTGQLDSNSERTSSNRSFNVRSGRRQRNNIMRSSFGSLSLRHRGMGDVALDTANMMMRGISETEQISMAIAASMRDQEVAQSDEDDDSESDGSNDTDVVSSTTENDNNSDSNIDNSGDPSEGEGSRDEASTITELARVVTDAHAPDGDTILNRIAA